MFILVVAVVEGFVWGSRVYRRRVRRLFTEFFERFGVPVARKVVEVEPGERLNKMVNVNVGKNVSAGDRFLVVVRAVYVGRSGEPEKKIVYSTVKKAYRPSYRSESWYVRFYLPWMSTLREKFGIPPNRVKAFDITVFRVPRDMSEQELREWTTFLYSRVLK